MHPHVKTIGTPFAASKLLSFLRTNPVAAPSVTAVLTRQPALQIFADMLIIYRLITTPLHLEIRAKSN